MKRKGLFVVFAVAFGAFGVVSVAQAKAPVMASNTGSMATHEFHQWYIVPRVGAVFSDSDRHVDNVAPIYGLGIGVWVNPSFTVDLEATYDEVGYDGGFIPSTAPSALQDANWDTFGLDVAGRWYFRNPAEKWRPYVMAGVGIWHHHASPSNGKDFSGFSSGWGPGVTAGVGILYTINSRFALRGELAARWYRDNDSDSFLNKAATDGDCVDCSGSENWLDWMATIGLVVNLNKPAPPPPPVAPPPPPPKQHVVIDLRGVNFKFDRPKKGETRIGPTLKPPTSASLAILNQAVDTLNRYPQVKIEIDGYTDSIGTDKYNQGLSERRANIVYHYLIGHNIPAYRITGVKGFGETHPIATNQTAAGRQRNRRVEFQVQQ